MTGGAATRIGLAALVVVLWGHGSYLVSHVHLSAEGDEGTPVQSRLGGRLIQELGSLGIGPEHVRVVIGAVSGALILGFQAALATGVEGPHPAALVAPLLTALSPTFARAVMAGREEILLAMLVFAGFYRALVETHRSGSAPWSAMLFGGAAGLGNGGLAALAAAFVQRIIFARRFRLGASVYRFAFIWLGIALAVFGLLRWIGGAWGPGLVSDRPPEPTLGPHLGIGGLLIRLWAEVDGLAVLPYVALLVVGWKPKALFFQLTMIGLLLAAMLPAAAESAALRSAMSPLIPLVFLAVGLGVRGIAPVLETSGLGGRVRSLVIAVIIGSLALGQAWPTLSFCLGRTNLR